MRKPAFRFCTVGSQSEDGLQRRVCALLSLPWVRENRSASAYKASGFPSWLPALAHRLDSCYCEDFPPLSRTDLVHRRALTPRSLCCFLAAPEVQADCVSLLALLPSGVCEAWRSLLFTKALQSPEEAVRVATVKAFPLLLHHLGTAHQGLIGTTLLYVNAGEKGTCVFSDVERAFMCVVPLQTQTEGRLGASEEGAGRDRRPAELPPVRVVPAHPHARRRP